MPPTPPTSRCSAGKPVEFIWFGATARADGEDPVDAACRVFHDLMHIPGRLWSPYSWPAVAAEFRNRVQLACLGGLKPVDEVQPIGRGRNEDIYEIRWDIAVCDSQTDGSKKFHEIQVRLYHAEPSELPNAFVGLHLHEKVIDAADDSRTRDLQNIEIDVARLRFLGGVTSLWGVR